MTTRDPAQAAAQPGEPGAAGPVRLPAIRVRTEPTEVAAFSRETFAAGTGDFVPLTFPFRWLTLPAIRALIVQLSGGEEFLPVHEAQSFVYERSLRTGADYVLDIAIETSSKATAAPDFENDGRGLARGNLRPARNNFEDCPPRRGDAFMTEAGYAPPPDWPSAGDEIGAQNFGPFGHDALVRYAAVSGDDNPLHLDPAAAMAAGLAGPPVHGMLMLAVSSLCSWDGGGIFSLRGFPAKFLRPVLVGGGHSRFGAGPAQPWGAEARTDVAAYRARSRRCPCDLGGSRGSCTERS